MGKSFEFKECERFLKRALKDKGLFTKGAVIAFLITGGIGIVAPPVQAWVSMNPDTGATTDWDDIGSEKPNKWAPARRDRLKSVILAPVKNSGVKSETNYDATNSVIIGTESYGHGTDNSADYGSGYRPERFTVVGTNAHAAGGQGTAIGSNTFAFDQGTAIGNDVYALGASSIAIGNDDITTRYKDKMDLDTLKRLYGDGSSNDVGTGLFKWVNYIKSDGNTASGGKKRLTSWDDFYRSYASTTDNFKYSPTMSAGVGAIAIGSRSLAAKDGATAIGTLSFALGEGSTAMGLRAFTAENAEGAVAIGEKSRSFAKQSLAVGNRNESSDIGAMSYGYNAKALGKGSLAFGYTSYANALIMNTIEPDSDGKNTTNPMRASVRKQLETYTEAQLKKLGEYQGKVQAYYDAIQNNASAATIATKKTEMETAKAEVAKFKVSSGNELGLVKGGFGGGKGTNAVNDAIRNYVTSVDSYKDKQALTIEKNDHVYLTTENKDGSTETVKKSKASGNNAISIGYYTAASGNASVAVGSGSVVDATSGIGIGSLSYVGDVAANSIALGVGAQVRKENSLSLGTQASVYGAGGVGIGSGVRLLGDDSVGIGYGTIVRSRRSVGLGRESSIGYGSMNATAVGTNTKIDENAGNTVALGNSANIGSEAINSMALGYNANIGKTSSNSIAIGTNASVINNATSAVALGDSAKVSASSSTALGRLAEASHDNSVALGYRSTTFYYGNPNTREASTSTTESDTNKPGLEIQPYLPPSASEGIKKKLKALNLGAAGYISVGGWDASVDENGNPLNNNAQLRGLRRIVNVAPGALDTDAVTVAQLREWTDKSAHFLSLAGADKKSAADFPKIKAPDGSTDVSSNFDNEGASGEHALALGVYAMGKGAGSISIGRSSFGQGTNSTTLGSYGWGRGEEATSIGYRAYSYGTQSVAIGTRTVTDSDWGIAIGNRARSWSEGLNGHSGIAIGSKATANYWNALALGTESKVRGWHSTAIGDGAQVGMPEVFNDDGVSMNVFKADGKSYNKANQVVYEKTGETNTEYTVKEYKPYTPGSTDPIEVKGTFTIQKPSTIHNALAFGSGASVTNDRVTDAKDSTRINEFSSAGSIAIGSGTSVKGSQNSVALGLNSKVVRTDTETNSTAAFTGDTNNDPGNGVVSIGTIRNTSDGRGVTRRIVGVAGGQDDFDAVNVKQLKAAVKYYKTNSTETGARTVNDVADVSANYNGEGATGTASVAIGSYTQASGSYSVALGRDVITSGNTAVGLGTNVSAFGNSSVVLGNNAIAGYTKTEDSKTVPVGAREGVAIGNASAVESHYTVAIGGNAKVLRDTSDANNIKNAESSVAIGASAKVIGASYSVALGLNSRVLYKDVKEKTSAAFIEDENSPTKLEQNNDPVNGVVSVGSDGTDREAPVRYRRIINVAGGANDYDAVNVKQLKAAAPKYYSVNSTEEQDNKAVNGMTGINSNRKNNGATGTNSVAIGSYANATAGNSVALGREVVTKGDNALGIGYAVTSTAQNGVAIGSIAKNTGTNGIAIGWQANNVDSSDSIVLGTEARVGTAASGTTAVKLANNSIAIGKGAIVETGQGSIALGWNSKVTADDVKYHPTIEGKTKASPYLLNDEVDKMKDADNGVVAVGRKRTSDDGSSLARRIVGVAGGYNEYDAVNVKQLKAAAWGLQVQNGTAATDVTPRGTGDLRKITLKAGDNVTLDNTNGVVTINASGGLNSITSGNADVLGVTTTAGAVTLSPKLATTITGTGTEANKLVTSTLVNSAINNIPVTTFKADAGGATADTEGTFTPTTNNKEINITGAGKNGTEKQTWTQGTERFYSDNIGTHLNSNGRVLVGLNDELSVKNITTYKYDTDGKRTTNAGVSLTTAGLVGNGTDAVTISSGDTDADAAKMAFNPKKTAGGKTTEANISVNNVKLTGLAGGEIKTGSTDAVTGGQLASKLAEKADASALEGKANVSALTGKLDKTAERHVKSGTFDANSGTITLTMADGDGTVKTGEDVTITGIPTKLGYTANSGTAKSVTVTTGLNFVQGDGTTATAASAKSGIEIVAGESGKVIVGLNASTRQAIDKVATLETAIGKSGADGRDGKLGKGEHAGMGKDGVTGKDGLNGTDLTTKVNALRNGEAGSVVYTDADGNRLVRATDGKWYPADTVKADGTVKTVGEDGITKAPVGLTADKVITSLVSPNGTTAPKADDTAKKAMTKLSNIAEGTISDKSNDAVTGRQLYAAKSELATALGGNAAVNTDGTLKQPTYSITKDDGTNGKESVKNVGAAVTKLDERITAARAYTDTKVGTAKTELTTSGLDFKGDDTNAVHRNLGTELTIKGGTNFTPVTAPATTTAGTTTTATTAGVNIRVEKDPTTNANGLVVKLADTLTGMKGITGNGTDPLTIKNGDTTITVKPSKPKDGDKPAVPSTVDFGGAKLSNIGEAKDNSDAANKAYVDNAVGGIQLGYKAETEEAKSVAVTTGLTFKAGTGTIAPTDLAAGATSTTATTDGLTTKKGIKITTEKDGVVNIGLDEATRKVIDQAAKLGDTAVDGRDGKAANGKTGAAGNAGDHGLTGADGLNGKDLTNKVNALRNGEAGTVVYTDDKGNRLVKANDGNYYKADDVKADGTLKTAAENGGKAPVAVMAPQARLVSPDGTTTSGTTKLTNIADGAIEAGSHDAVTGGQLHSKLADKADKSVVDTLTSTVNTNTADIGALKTNVDKAITFTADTGTGAARKLGDTLAVKGGTNFTPITTGTDVTPAGMNIQVKSDATNGLSVHLADTLTGMKGITGNGTDPLTITNGDTTITVKPSKVADGDKPAEASTVDFGGAKLTNIAAPKDNADVANKAYVDSKIGGVAELGYKADTDTAAKKVAVSTGLTFKSGTGTIAPTDLAAGATSTTAATDSVETKKGIKITTEKDGVVNIGLDESTRKVIDQAAKLGDTAVDGRDGKPGKGEHAGMGKDGVTGKDGLNGTDLTTKVNALRNGEAGSVVYTDADGNRLVRATDGKWYPADKVKADGTVKTIGEDGVTEAPVGLAADKVIASLVSPNGTTAPKADDTAKKAMTKLSNIAEGTISDKSNDAVTGRQLYTAKSELATALGGNAGVDANGALTGPTYSITKDDAAGTDNVNNVGAAVTKLDARINALKNSQLTFTGDSGSVTRKLGETLTVKGGANVDTTTTTMTDGINVRVEKDPTANANGLVVKLADTLTGMKGITGTGEGDLVIKNGGTTITIGKGTPAQGSTAAVPGPVNFSGAKLTNIGEANADSDATNKKYVDNAVGGVKLGYKANAEDPGKTVAVTKGLHFKSGTGTVGATGDGANTTNAETIKKGIVISTAKNGVVNIGLDTDTRTAIDKVATLETAIGKGGIDGRDGKPGKGEHAGMGKDGVTGKDGLNGTDLTTKVNALRNGEAGSVVYTDADGNRLVRATDGKWYPADKVKADGTVKTIGEDGITEAPVGLAADKVIASLVSPNGTTAPKADDTAKKAMTKLSNIAEGTISDKSNDAVTGRQLHAAKTEIGDIIGGTTIDANGKITGPTFTITKADGIDETATTIQGAIEKLNTTNVDQNSKISSLTSAVDKSITFVGDHDTNDKITRKLGDTLNIKGQNNITVTKATGTDNTLNVSLSSTLKNITSISSGTDNPGSTITLGANEVAFTNTQPVAADAPTGTQPVVTKTTIGKDGVKVGDAVTLDTAGLSGNGKAPLTIKNGDATITVKPSKPKDGDKLAEPSTVDFGGAKLTTTFIADKDSDITNKKYVDEAISKVNNAVAGNATLNFAGNVTKNNTDADVATVGLSLATGVLKVQGDTVAKDIVTTAKGDTITIGLHKDVKDQLAKVSTLETTIGTHGADGRDGKPGKGEHAGMGKDGVTGKDGLNGTDLTTKVNALRNGEAGSVVYTDADGNRLVRATDGKWYPADTVKADGTVKTVGEDGITKAPVGLAADKVIASLVSPNGTTAPKADDTAKKAMTKLSNIAEGTISDKSNDAVTGRQLHKAKQELATALGGNAGVDANGALTGPTYSITKDDAAGTDTVSNVGAAVTKLDTRINTVKESAAKPLTFTGDDGQGVERKLDTTLTVKGAANFTPTATTPTTAAGVNIRVEKDPTTNANGLVVKLADTLTGMKGITGNGTDPLVIKNGDTTITVKPSKPKDGDKPAVPSTVDFGGAKLSNIGEANADSDATNKKYVDNKVGGIKLGYKAETENAKSVAVTTGLTFKAGTGTIAPTNLAPTAESSTKTTDNVTTKKGIVISTENDGVVNIGLDTDTRKAIDKVATLETTIGKSGVDGRDGKAGTGANAGIGKEGLTGADGLNGTDLTTKVNALRNGEAGSVVYTDAEGNRVVKADDGKWYNAKAVDEKGKLKPVDQLPQGVTRDEVTNPQARLVNPNGTTTGGTTVFNNVASAIPAAAADGSNPTFLDNLNTAASNEKTKHAAVNVSDLNSTAKDIIVKGLTFQGNDGQGIKKQLGETLDIVGEGTLATTTTTAANNIRTKKNNDGKLEIGLAKDLVGITSITNGDTTITVKPSKPKDGDKPAVPSTVDFGGAKLSNIGEANADSDATNKKYVDTKVSGIQLGYKAETEGAKSVAVTTGLTFKAGTGTVGTTGDGANTTNAETIKKGITISTAENGVVNIGLDEATRKVIDQAAKLGDTAVDGRDGKAGTGKPADDAVATAGDKGLTGKDGLNGKDLTNKVNALRNGEAGTVVYTDDKGNRLVKANDGNYYPAGKVKADGTKADDAVAVTNPQARLVNPDGSTTIAEGKTGTVLSNIANGKIADKSTDAVTGGQLYTAKTELATALGGDAVVNANGTLKQPTYSITKDDATGGTDTVSNVGAAVTKLDERITAARGYTDTKVGTVKTELTTSGLDFKGDDTGVVHRNLGTELTIKGGANFTPVVAPATTTGTTSTATADSANIRVEKDPTTNANGLVVKLADTLTGMKGISGDGQNDLVIKNGTNTITVTPNTAEVKNDAGEVTKKADPGTVNFGGAKLITSSTATEGTDVTNKDYVDDAISKVNNAVAGNATLNFAGNVTKDEHNADTTKVGLPLATGVLKVQGDTVAKDIVTTAKGDTITIGLHQDVKDQLAKLGNTAADGRDGKPGTGANAGIGKEGLTGADGLNGTDLTTKVNALRNGEAGSVVYTDAEGNRVVKADDGKWYNAKAVDEHGKLKPADQLPQGVTRDEVTNPQARLVNPNGTTTGGTTVFNNVASPIANTVVKDAQDQPIANAPFLDRLKKTAADVQLQNAAVNVSDLNSTATEIIAKGLTFQGNDGNDIKKQLGETLHIVGEGTVPATITTAANNIRTKKNNDGKLEIGLAKDLVGITSITNETDVTKPSTKVEIGKDGITVTNTQPADATAGTAATTSKVTVGKDGVKVGDKVTINTSGMSGNGTDPLTIKNGDTTITVKPSKVADGDKLAEASTVDFGGAKLTNIAAPKDNADVANKAYVDSKIGGVAELGYKADTDTAAKKVAVSTGLTFKSGTGTIAPTDLAAGTTSTTAATDSVETKKGIKITTEKDGVVNIGLDESTRKVIDQAAKLGDTAVDGRDGKAANGQTGAAGNAGDHGLTGQDGLNGKTVTEKVNALRNGEAGTVVYTDDKGNRLVKANDGNYYKADDVKADGTVKTAEEAGTTDAPQAVKNVEARLVNSDGTTIPKATDADKKAMTKLSNIAEGAITSTSNDAVTGRQIHAERKALATALGGNAAVADDGTWTAPTYSITNDTNAATPDKVNNVGAAVEKLDARINTVKGLATKPLTFTGDDAKKVERALGTELTVKGGANFTPAATTTPATPGTTSAETTATTPATTAGVNIRVEKDPTTDANGLVVKLADTLTNMKGISGNGTDDLVIKNGDTTITVKPSKAKEGNNPAQPSTVDFGGAKLSNIGEAKDNSDAANKAYVDNAVGGIQLGYKAETEEAKSVAVTTGLNFKAGTGTIAPTDLAAGTTSTTAATDSVETKKGIKITTEAGGIVNIGLDESTRKVIDQAAKLGDTAVDGRDGKAANGKTGAAGNAGDHGLTGQDGLNGKDLTSKVNALRNGEAGTVVYTDKDGNRLVKTNDGKWYPATAVGDNGELKSVPAGGTAPVEVKPADVVASLVSPDGATTNATTVLNNVGSVLAPIVKDTATKAEDTNYLDKLAKATDSTSKVANAVVNVIDLKKTADAIIKQGLTFKGNDGTDIPKELGSTLSIVGEGNYGTPAVAPDTAAKNIFTKHVTENDVTRLEIGLAKDLVGITSIANETDTTKPITKVDIGKEGITVTNTQPVPAGAAAGTQPVVNTVTVGKDGVKVGDRVTLDKTGISGNGTDDLVIKNGDNAVITVKPSTGTDTKGTVDFGGTRITNIAEPKDGTDAANKSYVDGKIGNVAEIGYKANNEATTNKVAVGTGLHFKSGTGTIAPTDLAAGATSPTATTDTVTTKTGIAISTEADGVVNIGLDETTRKVIDKASKLGDTAVDGRDGKPGTGTNAGMGKDGLTGADGMNGKDLTSKVNALRNGEAGSVVYTDADGNRLVKADDGKFYKVTDVDEHGKVKVPATGGTAPVGLTADKVIASLVSPDGTTAPKATDTAKKAMTKLSNIAEGAITSTSNDAVTGRQIHAERKALATVLGGNAAVGDDGTWTAPTYSITNDANAATPDKVNNVGAAVEKLDARITTVKGLATKPLTFTGDDAKKVERALGTELTVKGGENFTPTTAATTTSGTTTTATTPAGVNIRVEKDPTANANGLVVKLADTLTNMKGISGNGTDDLVIKNGETTITIGKGTPATGGAKAVPGTVDFGGSKLTNVGEATADGDVTNKKYVDEKVAGINLGYKAETEEAKSVAVTTGLTFKAGTGTIAPTDLAAGATSTTATTDGLTTKKGIKITTEKDGVVNIGLDESTRKVIDQASKLGDTAVDGRDGKAANGKTGAAGNAGDHGLTGQDGLNGETVIEKVNALRNGEAGTVVYTDDKGNRLVKANDGNYYKATDVKADGTVKTAAEAGTKEDPKPVDTPQARLVNTDGTTTTATVFNNVASSIEKVKATDDKGKEIAKPAFLDRLKTAAATESSKLGVVNVKDLYDASKDIVDLGLDFYGNDEVEATGKVHRNLGTAVKIQGAGTFTRATGSTNNINVKRNTAQDGFTVELAENLTGMKEVAGNDTDNLVLRNGKDDATHTKVEVGTNKFTVTNSTSTPAATEGTAPTVTTGKLEMDADGTTTFTNSGAPANAVVINSKTGTITTGNTTVDGTSVSVKDGDKTSTMNADGVTVANGDDKTKVGSTGVSISDGTNAAVHSATESKFVADGKEASYSANGVHVTDGADKSVDVTSDGTTITNGTVTTTTKAGESEYVNGNKATTVNTEGMNVTDGTNTTNYTASGIILSPSASGTGTVSLTTAGLNNGGNRLTNVADATSDGDVVNLKQLKAGKTTFTVNDNDGVTTNHNLVLTTTKDATDNHTNYDVKLADTVTLGKDGNAVAINGTNASIIAGTGDNAVTVDGVNGKITTGKTEVSGSAVTIKDATNGTQVGATLIRVNGTKAADGAVTTNGIAIGHHADVKTSVETAAKENGNFITGLENKTWEPKTNGIVSGRAATEDQLKAVDSKINEGRMFTADTMNGTNPLEAKVGLGETLSIKGGADMKALTDNNIGVELKAAETKDGKAVTPATMTVKLAKDVKMADGTTSYDRYVPEYKKDDKGYVVFDQYGRPTILKEADGVTPKLQKDKEGHPYVLTNTVVDGRGTTYHSHNLDLTGKVQVDSQGKPVSALVTTVTAEGSKYELRHIGKDSLVQADAQGNPIVDVTTVVTSKGIQITPGEHFGKDPVSLSANGLDNGGNTISNVAPGVYESDAATVGQVRLATNTVTEKVNEAGAHAAALAAMNPLSYDPLKKSQVMAGVGAYKGNKALALGVAHYANEDTMFNVGVSVGGGENMMNAGVTYRFGGEDSMIPERYKGGPISSVYILQDEVSALKAENAQVKADNEQVKADNARMKENYEKVMQDNEEMKAQIKMLMAHMGIK